MLRSIIVNLAIAAFGCFLISDLNFEITHNYIYSALIMVMSALLVYGTVFFLSLEPKRQTTKDIEVPEFKFYGTKKKRWNQSLLSSNIVYVVWLLMAGLLTVSDRYFDRNEMISSNLEVVAAGTTSIGRSQAAYVVVRDKGRAVTCRGYFNHLLERDGSLTVDLIYSDTLIGFEQIDCEVKLS
ncbi:hypothetical protein [Vibrio coralliilyticus]|uniref:hypothetical protein n=1 Tax=Vibrio coralliilyticus TaxID=190893 RepID=UPI00155FAAC6|nr:hypothetical protein [Vibrio coralliilyticus]NRF28941.1 hypothetical protein [Vibrio coralliilyticus]NRF50808.1 hypothetical protein [Vibrio coralliilyticus]